MIFNFLKDFEELSIKYKNNQLLILDQRKLPEKEEWIICEDIEKMWLLIKQLSIRGAPLIGIAAALILSIKAQKGIIYQYYYLL